ncbi:MAG: hypothetical protein ACRCZF_12485 [Gemmataceae bacterium]
MTQYATITKLEDEQTPRVLSTGRVRAFYLLMAPAILSVLFCGFGGWLAANEEEFLVLGIAGIVLGVLLGLGYLLFETFFIGVFPARCYLRWLRERILARTDPIVLADDPNALFVQRIPRKNWHVSIGENADDVGLLVLDYTRKVLRYEGDQERWEVPADSIISFKLESFTPPNGVDFLNRHTVVMLKIDLGEEERPRVMPLAGHPIHWRPWTPGSRKECANLLREAIGHLVDPEDWPRPTVEELRPLLPPT